MISRPSGAKDRYRVDQAVVGDGDVASHRGDNLILLDRTARVRDEKGEGIKSPHRKRNYVRAAPQFPGS